MVIGQQIKEKRRGGVTMCLFNKILQPKGEEKEPEEEQNQVSFNPAELEKAFDRAYRSFRINGGSGMDVKTFFDWIRQNLIDVMNKELTDLDSARVQTTVWIRFILR